jgi:hypothetical protein
MQINWVAWPGLAEFSPVRHLAANRIASLNQKPCALMALPLFQKSIGVKSIAGPCFGLYTPLIEPEVPISGIRLLEKGAQWRPLKQRSYCVVLGC